VKFAVATSRGKRVWIPPNGRPYWINLGMPNAGPELTDKRLKRLGLMKFIKYPFDKIWAESHKVQRLKRKARD